MELAFKVRGMLLEEHRLISSWQRIELSRSADDARQLLVALTEASQCEPLPSLLPRVECLLGLVQDDNLYVSHCSGKLLAALSQSLLDEDEPSSWRLFCSAVWYSVSASTVKSSALAQGLLLLQKTAKLCNETQEPTRIATFFTHLIDNMASLATSLDCFRTSELVLGAFLRLMCTSVIMLQQLDADDLRSRFSDKLQTLWPLISKHAQSKSRFVRYKALVLLLRLSRLGDARVLACCLTIIITSARELVEHPLPIGPREVVAVCFPFSAKIEDDILDLQRRALLILFRAAAAGLDEPSAAEMLEGWLRAQTRLFDTVELLFAALVHLFSFEDDLFIEFLTILLEFKPVSGLSALSPDYEAFLAAAAPSKLFLYFLAAIQYDHSVITDLLISKDTGLPALRYLLRCLRLISENRLDVLPADKRKRRKFVKTPFFEVSVTRARSCLFEMEEAIRRLHSKGLFPYNASPLLQRCKSALMAFDQAQLKSSPQL